MLRRRPVMRMAATTAVVAGTAAVVSGRVNSRQQAKAQAAAPPADPQAPADALQEQAAAEPLAPPSVGLSEEAISQLQQLGALKEQGVLTEEEFAAQKAKILGS
jgi:Short C-terminal domain